MADIMYQCEKCKRVLDDVTELEGKIMCWKCYADFLEYKKEKVSVFEEWFNSKPVEEKIEKVFQEFWKDIIIKDGSVNMSQVKKELYDYRIFLREVSKVYMHVTDGKISKQNTLAEVVIALADESHNG